MVGCLDLLLDFVLCILFCLCLHLLFLLLRIRSWLLVCLLLPLLVLILGFLRGVLLCILRGVVYCLRFQPCLFNCFLFLLRFRFLSFPSCLLLCLLLLPFFCLRFQPCLFRCFLCLTLGLLFLLLVAAFLHALQRAHRLVLLLLGQPLISSLSRPAALVRLLLLHVFSVCFLLTTTVDPPLGLLILHMHSRPLCKPWLIPRCELYVLLGSHPTACLRLLRFQNHPVSGISRQLGPEGLLRVALRFLCGLIRQPHPLLFLLVRTHLRVPVSLQLVNYCRLVVRLLEAVLGLLPFTLTLFCLFCPSSLFIRQLLRPLFGLLAFAFGSIKLRFAQPLHLFHGLRFQPRGLRLQLLFLCRLLGLCVHVPSFHVRIPLSLTFLCHLIVLVDELLLLFHSAPSVGPSNNVLTHLSRFLDTVQCRRTQSPAISLTIEEFPSGKHLVRVETAHERRAVDVRDSAFALA
mmetsp:Transcript_144844/g.252573  ORF Transcript_144844/g.252573 Transcript_144844/m.252573 type:complete len:460 (-) Transcript_144844:1327-2706(-)